MAIADAWLNPENSTTNAGERGEEQHGEGDARGQHRRRQRLADDVGRQQHEERDQPGERARRRATSMRTAMFSENGSSIRIPWATRA